MTGATAEPPPSRPGTGLDVQPLAGFTVAVTAARRREELGGLLRRRGARVVYAPALTIIALADDAQLLAATRQCLDTRVDVTVATTGIGFRGWMEAADGWDLGEQLRASLRRGSIIARGPKARGAIRAAGLADAWSPPSESSTEVLEHLLADDLTGRRVVVQLHGEPLTDFVDALRAAGADVIVVPVYRWAQPDDVAPLHRLIEAIDARQVDAVTFTSAAAVISLLGAADSLHVTDRVVAALSDDVVAVCVGPVTAAPLRGVGVHPVHPRRGRLGALVREVVAEVPPRRSRALFLAGHDVELRGHAVVIDGRLREVPPASMAVMRALARRPGAVLSRSTLLPELPGQARDEHAVEMAVTRLRAALGQPRVVQTVVKRGYRLAVEPDRTAVQAGAR